MGHGKEVRGETGVQDGLYEEGGVVKEQRTATSRQFTVKKAGKEEPEMAQEQRPSSMAQRG